MSSSTSENALYSGPPVHPQAIVIASLAALAFLSTIPSFVIHYKNPNLPTTILILAVSFVNLQNVVNASLWPNDDTDSWYNGEVFCDIETKLQVGLSIAIPSSAVCICRRLATILSARHTNIVLTPQANRNQVVFEVLLCVILPITIMAVHIIVQPARFYIYSIVGCRYCVDKSWPGVVLIFVWPLFVSTIGLIYSVIIIYRLIQHRLQVADLLANAKVSAARFAKVFILASVLVLYTMAAVGIDIYYINVGDLSRWRWDYVHPAEWKELIIKKETGGVGWLEQWLQIASGFVVFIVFGLGNDALITYRGWMKMVGLHRLWHLGRLKRTNMPERRERAPGCMQPRLRVKNTDSELELSILQNELVCDTEEENANKRRKSLRVDIQPSGLNAHDQITTNAGSYR